jgi:serine/threonine protein kinase
MELDAGGLQAREARSIFCAVERRTPLEESTNSMLASAPAVLPRLVNVGSYIGDKYRVISCLGRGGMGEVVLARDLVSSGTVAIKILATRTTDTHTIARFLREARVMLQLESEHVASVLDVGALDFGLPYFVISKRPTRWASCTAI